jgi:hypothetical protein
MSRVKLPAFLEFCGGHLGYSPTVHKFRFIFQPGHLALKGFVPILPQWFVLCKPYPNKDGPTLWMWDQTTDNNISLYNTTTPERYQKVTPVCHLCTNVTFASSAIFLAIRVMFLSVIIKIIFKSYSDARWDIYIRDKPIAWALLSQDTTEYRGILWYHCFSWYPVGAATCIWAY